jgi:hypothetical protein
MESQKVDQYRFEQGTLYELSEDQDAYVACFTDYRMDTKIKAIRAYEEKILMEVNVNESIYGI